jgi:hypothetical protein
MTTIRSLLRAALLACLTIAAPVAAGAVQGCTPPVVPTNAIAVAEVAAQTAATVVSDAQAVWPILYAAIPAAQQPAAQDAFDKAVFAANHAVLALNDAIQAAIAANNPNPSFTTIIATLGDAVGQVVAIVQNFQDPSVLAKLRATGSGVDALADMQAAVAKIKTLAQR